MRLVRVEVEHFQCIEAASVELGPGLNVLHGPNDVGKSSLAAAIRAALLLPHTSVQRERFVPWYGGGDPRVALTFAGVGADDRTWRVTKVFGAPGGSSLLESSRDGRAYYREARGREVDEKIRTLLRWGIAPPGGVGGPRGIPDTFLVHVLLSAQEDVCRVLGGASLVRDTDISGRERLTEALGALAQDPLFKVILAEAQTQRDRAFTSEGRWRKRTVSPYAAIDARIKQLGDELDGVGTQVRASALAEERVRSLIEQRDTLEVELAEAREALDGTLARVAVERRREALRGQRARVEAAIASGEALGRSVAAAQVALAEAEAAAASAVEGARRAAAAVVERERERGEARARHDGLVHDEAFARRRGALEGAQRAARDEAQEAAREAEAAAGALQRAGARAAAFGEARGAAAAAAVAAEEAERASAAAARAVEEAGRALAEAEQRLRDATGERAQARELRRAELENGRLTRQAERAGHAAVVERAAAAAAAARAAAEAEAARAALAARCEAEARDVEVSRAALAGVEAELARLAALERAGELRRCEAARAAGVRAVEDGRRQRERAGELGAEAAALRAGVPAEVASRERIAALRALQGELRVAEGRLEVGLSVRVRPRRALELVAEVDGVAGTAVAAAAAAVHGAPLVLSARSRLAIRIDELVELEIAAGEDDARAAAATLRARWEAEGAPLLRSHGVDALEGLERVRASAEEQLRRAGELERDAALAEQRAGELAAGAERVAELEGQIAALERGLEGADREALDAQLDGLGAGWRGAIERLLRDVEGRRSSARAALEEGRARHARLEAQLAVQVAGAEAAGREAARLRDVLPGGEAAGREAAGALARLAGELAALEGELAALEAGGTDEEAAARAAVSAARGLLERRQGERGGRQAQAEAARRAAIEAGVRLEGAREQARELDLDGVWRGALEGGAALPLPLPLPLDAWRRAVAGAEQRQREAAAALEAAGRRLEAEAGARGAAIREARAALEAAEASGRGARLAVEESAARGDAAGQEVARQREALADHKLQAAGVDLEGARGALAALQVELDALGPAGPVALDEAGVEAQQQAVERRAGRLRETVQELHMARGALVHVGGDVVRERERELQQQLERERAREQEIGVEFEAWRLLVDSLKAAEAAEGTHLGRALAAPVSARFRELTAGRYGRLELDAHLRAEGIRAGGEVREIGELSAGTQEQLATLLRICVAEQLRTTIVLDDQLSQSDPERIGWFRAALRRAAEQIQIVLITCRPAELLGGGAAVEEGAAGAGDVAVAAARFSAIDLTQAIRRFRGAPEGGA